MQTALSSSDTSRPAKYFISSPPGLRAHNPTSCRVINLEAGRQPQSPYLQRLFPAPHLFDDGVGIGGPGEGLGVVVGFNEIAVDGDLEIDDPVEDAALEPLLG
jgi:hypothetical protein